MFSKLVNKLQRCLEQVLHVISGSYPQKVLWQQVTWDLLWLRSAAGPPILTGSLQGRSCDLEYDAPETRYYFVNMLK